MNKHVTPKNDAPRDEKKDLWLRERAVQASEAFHRRLTAKIEKEILGLGFCSSPDATHETLVRAEKEWMSTFADEMVRVSAVAKWKTGHALSEWELDRVLDSIERHSWPPEHIDQLFRSANHDISQTRRVFERICRNKRSILAKHWGEAATNTRTQTCPVPSETNPTTIHYRPLVFRRCSHCRRRRVVRSPECLTLSDASYSCEDSITDFLFFPRGEEFVCLLRTVQALDRMLKSDTQRSGRRLPSVPPNTHKTTTSDRDVIATEMVTTHLQQLIALCHEVPEHFTFVDAPILARRLDDWRGWALEKLKTENNIFCFLEPHTDDELERRRLHRLERRRLHQILIAYPYGAHYRDDLHTKLPKIGLTKIHRLLHPNYTYVQDEHASWASPVVSLGKGFYILRQFLHRDSIEAIYDHTLASRAIVGAWSNTFDCAIPITPLYSDVCSGEDPQRYLYDTRIKNALFENRMYALWADPVTQRLLLRVRPNRVSWKDLQDQCVRVIPRIQGSPNQSTMDVEALLSIYSRLSESLKIVPRGVVPRVSPFSVVPVGHPVPPAAASQRLATKLGLAIAKHDEDLKALQVVFDPARCLTFLENLSEAREAVSRILQAPRHKKVTKSHSIKTAQSSDKIDTVPHSPKNKITHHQLELALISQGLNVEKTVALFKQNLPFT